MSQAYCTLADLEAAATRRRLSEATDGDASTDEVVVAVVDPAIAAAGALIDGYLGKRYPLPLPMVPELIRRLAVDITLHGLFARVQDGEMSEGIRDRNKEALRVLDLIRQGEISLGLPANDPAPAPIGPVSNARPRLFGQGRLERMDYDMDGAASRGSYP